MSSLAILGAKPLFPEALHVGRPNIGDRDKLRRMLDEMLDRHWFTNDGPLVREFEAAVVHYAGVRHCVAMCNATVALQIAITALELKGEVIVPSFTFVATAHALQWLGIAPVFADVNPRTHNIDPEEIERLITPRTGGIIGVHVWGRPCEVDAIQKIAEHHSLKIMYDAAHAFGCSSRGRLIGGFGSCEVFSFHATKFINSFEGGAVVTNDGALADRLRLMRNFGFSGYDRVACLGINGKMTEVCAAMGLTSLAAVDDLIALNRRNYEAYRKGLNGLSGLSIARYDQDERNNYQYIVLEVDPAAAPLNRDELSAVLRRENVLARKYFWPGCHRMEPYRSLQPEAGGHLPQTQRVSSRVLLLPTGQQVTAAGAAAICEIIRAAFAEAARIRAVFSRPHAAIAALDEIA